VKIVLEAKKEEGHWPPFCRKSYRRIFHQRRNIGQLNKSTRRQHKICKENQLLLAPGPVNLEAVIEIREIRRRPFFNQIFFSSHRSKV
jgi:hypothetical protein